MIETKRSNPDAVIACMHKMDDPFSGVDVEIRQTISQTAPDIGQENNKWM